MIMQFVQTILYTQLLVFRLEHPRPGLNWNDDHVAQGFAWADGIASFGVPDHDGQCLIEVTDEPAAKVFDDRCTWALKVPFSTGSGRLRVGTVGLPRDCAILPGDHAIIFEGHQDVVLKDEPYAYLLRLRFIKDGGPDFRILKVGGEITTDRVLTTKADLS